ncbi:hypothetical protein SACS_1583 [Parasaccharibacter apium]|uniref:Uncharacterized protein n=1 Tax=Parasaccharibacter apium TaxID=1510841 RepID=A0A7U7J1U9_9PROT|nr:hypothetical protein SACS_1583 [Parasaccharibacter apium]
MPDRGKSGELRCVWKPDGGFPIDHDDEGPYVGHDMKSVVTIRSGRFLVSHRGEGRTWLLVAKFSG